LEESKKLEKLKKDIDFARNFIIEFSDEDKNSIKSNRENYSSLKKSAKSGRASIGI